MANRDDFITIISALRDASPTISNDQRKGLIRQAVQNYGLSVDEATEIFVSLGLVVGEDISFFDVLGFSTDAFRSIDEAEIQNLVEAGHKRLYSASLQAGGRPRADGRTEGQWRTLLNQARDVLIDTEKRQLYIASLQGNETSPIEFVSDQTEEVPEQTLTVPSEHEELSIPTPTEKEGMLLIQSGSFQMGSEEIIAYSDEKPVHSVYLDGYYIDKYPVTNAQYKEFVDANPEWCKPAKWYEMGKSGIESIPRKYHDGEYLKNWNFGIFPRGEEDHPVTWVSWYAAMAYARWVGKRLPTEAEWEKAARGGLTGEKYPWGDTIDTTYVNYDAWIGKTTAVGQYPANGYGLYDVVGNVYEWCLDKWDRNFYARSPENNPISGESINGTVNNYTEIKSSRILRGGSCVSTPQNVRVAYRSRNTPRYTCYSIGFRCVMSEDS